MHGTYTHRITSNLYPVQHYALERAAERANMPLAPFVRDAALAYVEQKIVLPPALEENLGRIHQEVRRMSVDLSQIVERANAIQRITHADLRHAGRLVKALDRQVAMLRSELTSLSSFSYDNQVNGS